MAKVAELLVIRENHKSCTGEQNVLEPRCLAEQNNGLYIPVDTEEDVVTAFEKTLGCPLLAQRAAR
jgi:Ca-activated chloride channel homolog